MIQSDMIQNVENSALRMVKNKLQIRLLIRWLAAPLLFAGLILVNAPVAYSGSFEKVDAGKQAEKLPSVIKLSDVDIDVREIKGRLKELESKERQDYKLELERQHHQVNWWLTTLALLAALMAIGGGFIPYLMARKDKEIIEQDLRIIDQHMKVIEQDKAHVKSLLDEIQELKHKASKDADVIREKLTIISGTSSALSEEVQQTAKETAQDETADPLLRLRAKAVEVSRPESAREAYTLWETLADLDLLDANARFNAGYWAHELGDNAQGDEQLRYLGLARKHYSLALSIAPDIHEAAYNWGGALDAEARALSATDLPTARTLWKQAGEKYQQALTIKPDYHKASSNWGTALLLEAVAISAIEPEDAKKLIAQAKNLLLKHAEDAPGEVAYNLACVYGLGGDVQTCLKWLQVSQEHKTLPDCKHIQEDKDFDKVRNDSAFVEWFKQVCP